MQLQEPISNNEILEFVVFWKANIGDHKDKQTGDRWRKDVHDTAEKQYTWKGS